MTHLLMSLGPCSMLLLPLHDGGAQAVVGNQALVGQPFICDRAGCVAEQPALKCQSLVCVPIPCHHWVFHHLLQAYSSMST